MAVVEIGNLDLVSFSTAVVFVVVAVVEGVVRDVKGSTFFVVVEDIVDVVVLIEVVLVVVIKPCLSLS